MTRAAYPKPSEVALHAQAAYAGPWRWTGAPGVRATDSRIGDFRLCSLEGTTKDGAQILMDIRFLPWWDRAGGVGPAGFVRGAASVVDRLIFDLADDARAGRLIFDGHSLGGALALRIAARFAALGHPPAVYAFDPPRSGGLRLRRIARRFPFLFISHDGNDEVPDVPRPYLHPGRVARIGHDGVFWWHRHRIAQIIDDLKAAGL